MKNKKGVELTIGSIVIIILALVVLVVLILGFTSGWKSLWGRAMIFTGSSEDVQTTIEACQVACAKQSTYDFCKKKWIVKEGEVRKNIGCIKLYNDNGMGDCDGFCSGVSGSFSGEEVISGKSESVVEENSVAG